MALSTHYLTAMHIWTDLLAREGALLLMLLALGTAPAAFLSERFDAAGRFALAPILGFCLGTCLATTTLEFVPADQTYWMLVPVALLSVGVAVWRTLRSYDGTGWRTRLPLRDVVQLFVVCVAVTGPLNYTLHAHHTVGPAAYTYTDVDNYVGEEDGARTTSTSEARDAWARAQQTGGHFADLTQWDWSFFASFNANPNAAPLNANTDTLLGLGATDTNAAFLITMLLAGALGAFAAVRYATRSPTWMAALAGALFGGPLFLELWFDTFQAAIIALGLLMPFAILGSETLRSRRVANLVLFALVFACFLTVYPVLAPILVVAGAIVVGWLAFAIRRGGGTLRLFARPAAISMGALAALVVALDNVSFVHVLDYYRKLLNNTVPLPRVTWHLPVQVLPGWLLQTREFWYMPSLGVGGFKQILLGALLPLVFLAFIVVGLRRHRPALALVALAGICALVAEYSYSSRDSCTYCAERDLLPLAPIAIVLLALGLATVLAMPQRWARVLGALGAALVVISVSQRAHVELTRFSDSSYFLDSANRSVLTHLPDDIKALQLEGYGESVAAQSEQPLVYYLADERLPERVSISLGSDINNATEYLDFGVIESPGPAFRPDYNYVLTRLAGIHTDRRVIARSGGVALEERTQPVDVMTYSGIEVPLVRLDKSGTAWVHPGSPLQMYVVGASDTRLWVRLVFRTQQQIGIPPQTDVSALQRGSTLIVCVPTTGTAPVRDASLRLIVPTTGTPHLTEKFPPAIPQEGVALTAMHAAEGRCTL
jgi:hypothetical protein